MRQDIVAVCRAIAAFTEEPGYTTRTFLSPPMHDVHALLRERMLRAGMSVSVDAAGNLRGVYGGRTARRLLIGSHLDTVPRAGAFDGILGVVMGVALVESLRGRRLSYGIEVIGFSEEEGVRFGAPFLGSRALVGTLDDELLAKCDGSGCSVREAIEQFGLDAARLGEAVMSSDVIGYLEVHIEQGPVLESLDCPLGVVEAIAGQSRYLLRWEGKANHAGTTPMALRRDALTAASRWVVRVEEVARELEGLVATVGQLEVEPNAGNVIPGLVRASLDVRHAGDAVRETALRRILEEARRIAGQCGITVSWEQRLEQRAVPMDVRLTELLAEAVPGAPRLMSGAGHDAMIVAQRAPVAMLFLRSPGGISHHPDEAVQEEDVEAAYQACRRFLEVLDV
ncbi:MAG: allantoate amidohydrolase [Acidobacteria bacterium]|nr:allantoate amidohydrolase [Acidobacteriota bacterium]